MQQNYLASDAKKYSTSCSSPAGWNSVVDSERWIPWASTVPCGSGVTWWERSLTRMFQLKNKQNKI